MTKFNYSLDEGDPSFYSNRMPLTPDEIDEFNLMFTAIKAEGFSIPVGALSDMDDIMSQFEADHKLSEKQQQYVRDIYERYCV